MLVLPCGGLVSWSAALRPRRPPAHVELLFVLTNDAKTKPAVEGDGGVASYHIERDRPPCGLRALKQGPDQTRSDPAIAEAIDDVELMQVESVGGLRNLHPADIGAARRDHLRLFGLECSPEARDDPALLPSAERGEQPLCALEVKGGGKIVVARLCRAKRYF